MMARRVRIAAVSYLNTVPFVYGIQSAGEYLPHDLLLSPPSGCPPIIERGDADIALVTVAEIPQLKTHVRLISDYCLGTRGKVRSVVLLANKPVDQLKTIVLDPDSRTSNLLIRILCKEYWKISPQFTERINHTDIDCTASDTGYILIGDRVFDYETRFKHCLDLSTCWLEATGMPFVFAAWVATDNVDARTEAYFNQALRNGVDNISVAAANSTIIDPQKAIEYLTQNLDFQFNKEKHKALALFWEKGMKCHELVNPG